VSLRFEAKRLPLWTTQAIAVPSGSEADRGLSPATTAT